jgi:molybdenum cofactor cytidylyltransferase
MDLNHSSELNLAGALRLHSKDQFTAYHDLRAAFTGAGGKTTALFQLARQLPAPVLVTASTHLSTAQLTLADRHFYISKLGELDALESQLFEGVVLLTGPDNGAGRTHGLDDSILDGLHILAGSVGVPLLVEADGSRRLPIKAPAEHEPAIPWFSNLVVVVAGLSGLGHELDETHVHRPERFAALSGLRIGERVDDQALVRVLLHPRGGLKGIPGSARRSILLNQVDNLDLFDKANGMAGILLEKYQSVLVASLGEPAPRVHCVYEKTAGIVLAAGGSSRLGTPKQLLEWHGVPFVRHVAQRALDAGLAPVVVVTGAYSPEVEAALQGLEIQTAYNPDWEKGQSSSVKVGIRALSPENGSAIFLLSDQPQVYESLIQELIRSHSATLAPIVAPRVHGKRANPVLFDKRVFSELLLLQGDTGGRRLIAEGERFPTHWIDLDDDKMLLDVDTQADYQRLLELEFEP